MVYLRICDSPILFLGKGISCNETFYTYALGSVVSDYIEICRENAFSVSGGGISENSDEVNLCQKIGYILMKFLECGYYIEFTMKKEIWWVHTHTDTTYLQKQI